MCVGAIEPKFYEIFLEKLGISSHEMPQFENFEESREKLEKIFKQKTQAEWCAIFDGTDACVTPVLNLKDVASHAHNKERNIFKTGDNGLVTPNPAPRLSRTPGISKKHERNAKLGEHTTEILTELDFKPEEIVNLIANGIVNQGMKHSKL